MSSLATTETAHDSQCNGVPPQDDSVIEKRISDFLLAASSESLDVVAEELFALRDRSTQSEEDLAALMEKYRNADLKNGDLKETVSKLSAELLAHMSSRSPESRDRTEELDCRGKQQAERDANSKHSNHFHIGQLLSECVCRKR